MPIDEEQTVAPHLPRARPALFALAASAAVSLAMITGTIVLANRNTARTTELVEDSLQSVQLVGQLRSRVFQLDTASPPEREVLVAQIATALDAYRPIATYPGEAAELARLEPVLAAFVQNGADAPDRAARRALIRLSLARLAEINGYEAERTLEEITDAHWHAVLAQILAALVVLSASGIAALAIHRIIRRQRTIIAEDVHRLSERNRDLAEFAGRTAHDLRAPLMPIRGYADLLMLGAVADIPAAAARIRRASDRMSDVIETLLALALSGRSAAGVTQVQPVVDDVLSDLATALVDVEVVKEIEDCRVACAATLLSQVLHNVIGNAAKYQSPDRRPVVRIEGKRIDSQFEIAIEDNGVGIAQESLARVFEPYYRAPGTQALPGSGLGLAIVRRMLDSIDGTCELSSELGRGSRFVIRVPVA